MSKSNLADPVEENEKQPRLIGSNTKSPSSGRKMKEEKNKSATGKKQGTEMAQNWRERQSEKTLGEGLESIGR